MQVQLSFCVLPNAMHTESSVNCCVVIPCRNPSLCRLQSTHRRPLYPQSTGSPLAQQVPEMQRLPGAAGGQVLQQGRQRLLQRRFLQVSSFDNIFFVHLFYKKKNLSCLKKYIFKTNAVIDGDLLIFQKGDSGPNAQPVSRGYRPHRWWGERRTSSTTCTVLPASCARGNWPQVTSTTWWRTAGWCVRPTMRPPNREVSELRAPWLYSLTGLGEKNTCLRPEIALFVDLFLITCFGAAGLTRQWGHP